MSCDYSTMVQGKCLPLEVCGFSRGSECQNDMARLLRISSLLVVAVLTTACAGRVNPSELADLQAAGETVIPIAEFSDPEQTWQRPLHPRANTTFVTIDGACYYRLGPGDILELTLYLEEEPAVTGLTIDPAGDVRLPTLLPGEKIRLAGLALPQAEARLATALERVLRQPQLSLEVTEYLSSTATLLGEVFTRGMASGRGEGLYPLTNRTTLLDFILMNAAFSDESDLTSVMVTDRDGRRGVFDLSAVMYRGDQDQNPVLDHGDAVLVPSIHLTRRRIYVLGEVMTPSLLAARPGLTVLDAIVEAGGPTEHANRKTLTLVRGRGAEAQLYTIPYSRVFREADVGWNIDLAAGDIIYLGQSGYDSAIEFFRDIWSVMQTAVVATILVERFK